MALGASSHLSITLIFFAPALFDVQHLKNSTNPLGFYGVLMGPLSISRQYWVSPKLKLLNSRDPQARSVSISSTPVFFRLGVLLTVSSECVPCCYIEFLMILRVPHHGEVVGPVWLCLAEPSSRSGHPGIRIVRNIICYTYQGGTMYNKGWNKHLSAGRRFEFGSHPEV